MPPRPSTSPAAVYFQRNYRVMEMCTASNRWEQAPDLDPTSRFFEVSLQSNSLKHGLLYLL